MQINNNFNWKDINNNIDRNFLEWLIGFAEGDGSFIVAKRGDISFVITQKDVAILNYIKENLGFGSVLLQSKKQKTYRFVVQDINSLITIAKIFNGNIVLPHRFSKFQIFLAYLNKKLIRSNNLIIPNMNLVLPPIDSNWLLGLTDAEGCFSVSLLSKGQAFRFRFILSQKYEKEILEYLLKELSKDKRIGAVVPHSVPDV